MEVYEEGSGDCDAFMDPGDYGQEASKVQSGQWKLQLIK